MKKSILLYLGIFILMTAFAFGQDELTDFREINKIQNPSNKIVALQSFLKNYPGSNLKSRIYLELFRSYLQLNAVDSALDAGRRGIALTPDANRDLNYWLIAVGLLSKGVALDTAEVYATRAVKWAQDVQYAEYPEVLNTLALILEKRGKTKEAEKCALELVELSPNNAEYQFTLALCENANYEFESALKSLVRAILFGKSDDAVNMFNNILHQWKLPDESEKAKVTLVKEVIDAFMDKTKTVDLAHAQSICAAVYARLGVDLKHAREWAISALQFKDENIDLDEEIERTKNFALVSIAQEKYQEATATLSSISDLVDPWNIEFWKLFGQAYEKQQKHDQAREAYLNGLVVGKDSILLNLHERLRTEKEKSETPIDTLIQRCILKLENFRPKEITKTKNRNGLVVLAELFTGAECGPCVAADKALDLLSDIYSPESLAILEYHLHIPGPDPLSNSDSWDQYLSYGANFGTPTLIIDGKTKLTGGGPKLLVKNRYNVFKYSLQREQKRKSKISMTLNSKLRSDSILINISIQSSGIDSVNANYLHIAVVEKTVEYKGGNGIDHHSYVVRELPDGMNGIPLDMKSGRSNITKIVPVKEIEKKIKMYLDNVVTHQSWRSSFGNFKGWKQRPDTINPENLVIVAWIQNPVSRQVEQSAMTKVNQ